MLEVAEDLPVPAVEGAVRDAEQLGRALHVHLLVADGLKRMMSIFLHEWEIGMLSRMLSQSNVIN